MMALNRYRLKHQRKKSAGARRAAKLLDRPDRLIGIILIGNNAINIAAALVFDRIVSHYVDPQAAFWLTTFLLTIIMLVFAEVTPKTIAAQHPEAIAFRVSHILKPLLSIVYPVVWLVNGLSNGLATLIGLNPRKARDDGLDKDELRTVLDESNHKISDRHSGMMKGILELDNVTVEDIMIPRNEVVGLDLEHDIDSLIDQIVESDYTRMPVFEGDINNIVGLLHMRRATRLLRGGSETLTKEALKRFAREPYFIPEGTPLNTQLINFQKEKRRMALVVDEYGDIQGLVTLEDLLEEIVGDFTTNTAESDDDITPKDDGSYLIQGSASVRDINKVCGWALSTDGPKTLNGLALEWLESIPDGHVCFRIDNCLFETVSITDRRIDSVTGRALYTPLADEES